MLQFLKSLINRDTPARVSAFLATTAGLTLCLGFLITLSAIVFGRPMTAELATITAGVVALATFNKVDSQH